MKKNTQNKKISRIRSYTMETNEKIEHINKPIKYSTMGFVPVTFYIAHWHFITVASLPTEPPRLYMP